MNCHYCGTPATHLDLCHGRLPVCGVHNRLGHQLQKLMPPEPEAKPRRRP